MFKEEDIIAGCKKGESFAQKILYEQYSRLMYGVCSRYIEDVEELRDVVQEGFIKVFTNIKKFRGDGSFEGWMKRIFINYAITFVKQNKRHKHTIDIDDMQAERLTDYDNNNGSFGGKKIDKKDIDINKIDYEMVNEADFSHDELLETLKQLPEPFRLVFNLSVIEDLKHEEIAEMLNIDTATSRTRLLRARNLLQKVLYEKSVERLCKQ